MAKNTVNITGIPAGQVGAQARSAVSAVSKAVSGITTEIGVEVNPNDLAAAQKAVIQSAQDAGLAWRRVFRQAAKEAAGDVNAFARASTEMMARVERSAGKIFQVSFGENSGPGLSGTKKSLKGKLARSHLSAMRREQELAMVEVMSQGDADLLKILKGGGTWKSKTDLAMRKNASSLGSKSISNTPQGRQTKKVLEEVQTKLLTNYMNQQYKAYEKEFGPQGAFSRAQADVRAMPIHGIQAGRGGAAHSRIYGAAISSSIGPASVQAHVDAEAKKSRAAADLKVKQESAEEQKTSNWVFKQRQADNKRKSQSASRVPTQFSKASISNRLNDEILASSLEAHEVSDTFHADEMAKIATAEANKTLTPKQARIARARLAKATFKYPSEAVDFRPGEKGVNDSIVSKIHDDSLADLRPGVQARLESLGRIEGKRRAKAARIRAKGGPDAENRAKNLESQADRTFASAGRLRELYNEYTVDYAADSKAGGQGTANLKFRESHQNLAAAMRGGNAGKRGDKGFNQKWNYAMPQLAYGLEDFFQVIAMGQSPLRGFLAAANNLGPALSALGLKGGLASVAVAGMLGVAAIFNHTSKSSKKNTDEWTDSLKRLGEVALEAEAAHTKLNSGLFSTAAGKFSDASSGILGKILESPEKSNATLQNINRLRVSNESMPFLSAQQQGMMKLPQAMGSRFGHNTEIFFNSVFANMKDAWDSVFTSDVVRHDVSDEDFLKPLTIPQLRHLAPGAIGWGDFKATSQTASALQDQYKKDNADGGAIQIRRKKMSELNAQGAQLDEVAREERKMTPQKIAEGFTRALNNEAMSGQRGGAASYLKSVQSSYEDAKHNASVAKDHLEDVVGSSDQARMNTNRLKKLREMYQYATTGTTGNIFRDGDIASGSDYEEYQRNINGSGGGRAVAALRLHAEIAKREADKKVSDKEMQNAEKGKQNAGLILKNRQRGLQEAINGPGGMAEMAAVFGIDLGTASSIDMNNRAKSLKTDKLKVLIKDKSQRDFLIDALGDQTNQKNNSSFMNDPRVRAVVASRGGFIDPFDYGGVSGRSLNLRDSVSSILEDRQAAMLSAKSMPAKTANEKKLRDDAITAVEASTNRKLAQEIYSKYNLQEPRSVRMMDSEGLYKAIQESLTVDPAYELEANQLEVLRSIFEVLSGTKSLEEARAKLSGQGQAEFDKITGGNKEILGGVAAMGVKSVKDLQAERKAISDELAAGVEPEIEQDKRDRIDELNKEINARKASGDLSMNGGLGGGPGNLVADIASNTQQMVAVDMKPYMQEMVGLLKEALNVQNGILDNTSENMIAVTV